MPDTNTDNEFALDPIPEAAPVVEPVAPVAAPDVLMVRGPAAKGHGVKKAFVPADEVANYKAAGWFVA